MTIRFFILQAHYRGTLDFSNEALQAAEKGYKRVTVESGGISSDTGAASGDDRQTSLELKLNGVKYQNV